MNMAFPCFFPINEKFAEKQGDSYGKSAKSVLGNGAFVMTNWEPGSIAEFKKNEDYYEAKTVKIEKLVMKLVQDPKVAAQSFMAGETDYAPINSDLVDKYKKIKLLNKFMMVISIIYQLTLKMKILQIQILDKQFHYQLIAKICVIKY